MSKAVEGTPFEVLKGTLKEENMFFFIPEGEAKPAYEGFKRWQKEIKRQEPEHEPKTAIASLHRCRARGAAGGRKCAGVCGG
jgi:hypothetical protein